MFVHGVKNKKTGKVFISYYICKRVNGKPKNIMVEGIGFLDELPHNLDWYKAEAKRRTKEEKEEANNKDNLRSNYYQFSNEYDKSVFGNKVENENKLYNYGVLALSSLYHELELDYFINNRRRYTNAEFNHNSILKMLVYSRILNPCSKLATWREREKLIEKYDFTEDDVYRSLPFFAHYKDDMIKHINNKLIENGYRTNKRIAYYDVTNYYWEIDTPDEDKILENGQLIEGLRKNGCSKEHRPEPIVQMGLMMDSAGLPISYGLFPGNNNDVMTFRPMVEHVEKRYDFNNTIYIADKGMMSGMNIASLIIGNNGFVISASVRNASDEIKKYVLTQDGYTEQKDDDGNVIFKYKECFVPTKINILTQDGKKKKETVNVRQIVFFSEKYKKRAKADRDKAIEKAKNHIRQNPKNAAVNTHGANKYIEKTIFDGNSNTLVENPEFAFSLNENLIAEQEALDGYYLLYSNVFHSDTCKDGIAYFSHKDNCLNVPEPVTTKDIIEMYRGLWRIEHCFRLGKSYLETRPVYVRTRESIEAHFLTCYVALVILKMLEKKTNYKIENEVIVDELRKAYVTRIEEDGTTRFENSYCSNAIYAIGKAIGLPLNKKKYSEVELKKMIAQTKKN